MRRSAYDYDALIACGKGDLFGRGNPQLPLPPMLMFDRITHIDDTDGNHGRGSVIAELDIRPALWFFDCHFKGDPVMPGCLGLDAMWQLLGFFLGWSGHTGQGRALGAGEVKFIGQVVPGVQLIRYRLDIARVIRRTLTMGIAHAELSADDKVIYSAKNLKVGLFQSMEKF